MLAQSNLKRSNDPMHKILVAVALAALAAGSTAAAACADQTSILDEFPPHEWHGQAGWLITGWSWAKSQEAP
jgi:opacity protein-like surface antigen